MKTSKVYRVNYNEMSETVTKFGKLKKKYALNNSYFKNRTPNMPSTPFEVLEYFKEHNELPYDNRQITSDWFYDCITEFQKRGGVQNQQFFTPAKTAEKIAELAKKYSSKDDVRILEPCCGFGQITRKLVNLGFSQISAFDLDHELVDVCNFFLGEYIDVCQLSYEDKEAPFFTYDLIISNPPYDIRGLSSFLEFTYEHLYENGFAILLIPQGFLDKTRPSKLVQVLNGFSIKERIKMEERFARTPTRAEIVVLQK